MSVERFLALTGDDRAIRSMLGSVVPEAGAAHHLNLILNLTGLTVFASPETPFIELGGNHGVLVGKLFRNDGDRQRVGSLGPAEGCLASETMGQSLIEGYWGNYVAFIQRGGETIVLRDPSAAVPAYRGKRAGIAIYCSDLGVAAELAKGAGIDEDYLRESLTFPFLRTARTGLEGWREILPGTSHHAGQGIVPRWTPARAARAARIHGPAEAAGLVRECAISTVGRLCEDLASPALELSGGLDSSIVAACLHQRGIGFEAINFATLLPDGDERGYAARVARHFGLGLTELVEDRLPIDLRASTGRSFRAPLSPILQPLDRARQAFAHARSETSFVTGAGGDNIFCYLGTAAPVLDAFSCLGIGGGFRTLADVAALGDCTIFKAVRYALLKALHRPFRKSWKQDRRFLDRSAIAGRVPMHPWLADAGSLLAGSLEHVHSLVRAQHFLETRYGWGGEVRHPLLNQPLMEACLSVPSWLWVEGGRNRSVARDGFSSLLPPDIVNRRTKGRLESMCARAFVNKKTEIAELLLEGELCARRLLDRDGLEAFLRAPDLPGDDSYFRIFDLVSLESWLGAMRG